MSTTPREAPVSAAEFRSLFAGLERAPGLLLAVSGGPDSTALLVLAARWQRALKTRPPLVAVTVDHGLRKEAKAEVVAVAKLAASLGIPHRILRWRGRKPSTGLQQAARQARYRLLAGAAKVAGVSHIVTAHTRDDQAETVLMRMARGSGLTGLGAMAAQSRFGAVVLLRPFLDVPKARLVATLRAAKIPFAADPSNDDPRFTRVRWRTLMPQLAGEGLDARRLSLLATRLRRADAALEAQVDRAMAELAIEAPGAAAFPADGLVRLPVEVAVRLMGRAVTRFASEGSVELGKLESLLEALLAAVRPGKRAVGRFRRTLAGALVTLAGGRVTVETAPARRKRPIGAGRPRP
jgi:tRNA(Ile)-lysidine synthase